MRKTRFFLSYIYSKFYFNLMSYKSYDIKLKKVIP